MRGERHRGAGEVGIADGFLPRLCGDSTLATLTKRNSASGRIARCSAVAVNPSLVARKSRARSHPAMNPSSASGGTSNALMSLIGFVVDGTCGFGSLLAGEVTSRDGAASPDPTVLPLPSALARLQSALCGCCSI
jgi:hypothetical protein